MPHRRIFLSAFLGAASLGLAGLLSACGQGGMFGKMFHEGPPPRPRYLVGEPYQVGGAWQYPRAQFSYDETGLAAVDEAEHPWLATDGEAFDQGVLAASHRTLQLPAIARVTNLDTGLSIVVRINDRGPAAPGRLISLTQRAATLLQAKDGSRVRVEVLEGPSRTLAAQLGGDGPKLALAAAPGADVSSEVLAPPPGASSSAQIRHGRAAPDVSQVSAEPSPEEMPLRPPENVTQGPIGGGEIFIDAGAFGSEEFARMLQGRISDLGARVSTGYDAPRERAYAVRIGPIASVKAADAMLARALAEGATDARIVVAR